MTAPIPAVDHELDRVFQTTIVDRVAAVGVEVLVLQHSAIMPIFAAEWLGAGARQRGHIQADNREHLVSGVKQCIALVSPSQADDFATRLVDDQLVAAAGSPVTEWSLTTLLAHAGGVGFVVVGTAQGHPVMAISATGLAIAMKPFLTVAGGFTRGAAEEAHSMGRDWMRIYGRRWMDLPPVVNDESGRPDR
jgi:hypothetical protein